MTKKRLAVCGTRHYSDRNIPSEIRAALELTLVKHRAKIGLEEWSDTRRDRSGFKSVCDAKAVPWADIGTPPTVEYTTYDVTLALDFPGPANIRQHGPFDIQERREEMMRTNVINALSSHESGVLVVGVAHLQSMSMKLKN